MNKKFIPFSDLTIYQQVIVVGSYHPDGFVLSQWKGAPEVAERPADTHTGLVLNTLETGLQELEQYPYVTNYYFDIDGFLGIWSLSFPEKALKHSHILRKMAQIASFRELNLQEAEDHLALKLVCWITTVERIRFYPPFACNEPGKDEAKSCVAKYEFFLRQFGKVLQDPAEFRHDWKDEYEEVMAGLQVLQEGAGAVSLHQDIRLLVVQTPEPLHYYALFSQSQPADMVLSMYDQNRYELEYKYTTWINTKSRKGYPRLDLQPLARLLNQHEENPYVWRSERITDTHPNLRLGGEKLNKEQRFDHPYKRIIHSSSIPPAKIITLITDYFKKAYQQLNRKADWTWEEIREVNRQLQQKS